MKYRRLSILTVIAALLVPGLSHAQGMSELDIGGFEKREGVTAKEAVKSPFSPSKPSPEYMLPEDLFLIGVAIGSGRSYALISGHIVAEGDSIAGLRVRSISRDRVILQKLDKIHTLYIEGGI